MTRPMDFQHGWLRARRNVDKARGRVRRLAREQHLRLRLLLTDGLELGHGMRLAEVEVPGALVGKTLRELQLRARHGVEVLYVLKGTYRIRKLADPDLSLDAGDHMVVMAEASSLLAFRQAHAPAER